MDITVVICTRNRRASLERLLVSASKLKLPQIGWEMLIVDNGTGNAAEDLVHSYRDRLPLRFVHEPSPGLSRARNTGLMNAHGQYIIWTDDDVVLDPDWLRAYAKAIGAHPDAAVLGGRIIPCLEEPQTQWFARNLDLLSELVAFRDFGPNCLPLSLSDQRVPFGANYAVRTIEQRQFRYNINLGHGTGTVGDETSVIRSILESGHSGWWIPSAIVHHIIPPSRQTIAHVIAFCEAQGVTRVRLDASRSAQLRIATSAVRAAAAYLLYRAAYGLNFERLWIRRLKGYAFWRGVAKELGRKQ